jgi:hypothetical protein
MNLPYIEVVLLQCLLSCAVYAYHPSLDASSLSRSNEPPTTRRNFLQSSASLVAGGLTSTLIADPSNADALSAGIALPSMGLGAWAWGDSLFWGCTCCRVALPFPLDIFNGNLSNPSTRFVGFLLF